jgi:hypothetical protein
LLFPAKCQTASPDGRGLAFGLASAPSVLPAGRRPSAAIASSRSPGLRLGRPHDLPGPWGQWSSWRLVAYSCGGSRGLGRTLTAFPFHPPEWALLALNLSQGTTRLKRPNGQPAPAGEQASHFKGSGMMVIWHSSSVSRPALAHCGVVLPLQAMLDHGDDATHRAPCHRPARRQVPAENGERSEPCAPRSAGTGHPSEPPRKRL